MPRTIRAPRGVHLTCKNWLIEAAYRMLQNNLDPEVAFDPDNLVVYGGRGRAARNWQCFDAILHSLEQLEPDETLLVQSGKPVAVFRTHEDAPRVLLANSNIVPHWATEENFDKWEQAGLIMFGQMTAGSCASGPTAPPTRSTIAASCPPLHPSTVLSGLRSLPLGRR